MSDSARLPDAGTPGLPDRVSWPTGVCMLTGELPPDHGGVGDYTARLSDALAGTGLPVRVLTGRRPGVPERRRLGSNAVPVAGIVPAWNARAWPLIRRALTRLGSRPLLHIQFQAGAFDLGVAVHAVPGLLRGVFPSARVVTTFHDFLPPHPFPKSGPLGKPANQLLARSSHAAIFTDLRDLEQAGPGVRGFVVPIGSNVDCAPAPEPSREDIRRLLGANERTFLVGYFGFLNPSKGVPTLLEAIRRLAESSPDRSVRLAMLGSESGVSNPTDLAQARAVHDMFADGHLADVIVKTGYLPPADLSAALLACDVIALPFQDGASARRGTLMAALAHGMPTVSTLPPQPAPVGGPRAFWLGAGPGATAVRDGDALLLVPPGDALALATALGRLRDSSALRERLAAGARAVAGRIAWPALAAETLRIYATTFSDARG
jgi:glycosyltransferase involved in cell wall biosynthesis